MGKPTGFMEISRQERTYALAADRIQHYSEFTISLTDDEVSRQGARCMDCGIPYCHEDAPSTMSFRTGTIWYIRITGAKRWMYYTAPITFQSSRDVFVRARVKPRVL